MELVAVAASGNVNRPYEVFKIDLPSAHAQGDIHDVREH